MKPLRRHEVIENMSTTQRKAYLGWRSACDDLYSAIDLLARLEAIQETPGTSAHDIKMSLPLLERAASCARQRFDNLVRSNR